MTFSQTWCECLQLASKNNASVDDITLFRLPPDASPPLSRRFQYSVVQHVRDPNLAFEYWQATLHLGASGVASFSFSHPVNVYFVSAFYANGQGHDPDYSVRVGDRGGVGGGSPLTLSAVSLRVHVGQCHRGRAPIAPHHRGQRIGGAVGMGV